MAVGSQGRLAGTIGGGALELEAIGQARAHLLEKKNGTAAFDLSSAAGELGMVCGGNAEVLYTYLPPEDTTLHVLSLIEACLETHTAGRLILPYSAGIGFIDGHGELFGLPGITAHDFPDQAAVVSLSSGQYFTMPLTGAGGVILIGGGHVAQALARLLAWLDFSYRVVDDRPEYADGAPFPDAESVRTLPYTELGQVAVGPDDSIVIATAGHRGDYAAEKWALTTPAAYIGVIGSAKKTAYVRDLLKKDGFSQADLDRVTAPIGLPIGSDTPAEIAVSIAAQLIQNRSRRRGAESR